MSNLAITWAYEQKIASGPKFVLLALADMADEDHSCFPGQAKLAVMTGQGVRTVRRQLLELELAGYLVRRRRFDESGHRTSDRYVLPVGQKIPTGQNGQRPKQPVAKSTGGQSDLRPVSTALAAIDDSPTGQNGQVSLREPPVEPPVSSTPPTKSDARGSRLPDGWKPTAELIAWARSQAIPDETARAEHLKFVDYWKSQPGARGRKADWPATWRNWMRNASDRMPSGRGKSAQQQDTDDMFARAAKRMGVDQ